MAEWDLKSNYDYRFGTLMLQASCSNERSPIYHLRLSDILRHVAPHELRHYLQDATQPYEPEMDLDEMRRKLITDTDWKDKTVLDVGGYDGWAAKLALDCGAKRAICLDNHQYEHYGWEDKKFGGVEYVQGDFTTLGLAGEELYCESQSLYGLPRPDVIIFLNVLYHLKNPWAGLDKLRELIKPDGEMLLCTLFRYSDQPTLYLYEPRECNKDDDTVYFGPSISALERLLTLTGWDFQQEGICADRVTYRCKPSPGWQRKHQDS